MDNTHKKSKLIKKPVLKSRAEVWEVFVNVKNRFPEKTAIINGNHSINFQELYNRAEVLGRYIKAKKMTKIILLFDQGIEMVIAMLASLKNHITYIPFDPNLPLARLFDLAKESQAEYLLSDLYNEDLSTLISQKTHVKSIIYNIEQMLNVIEEEDMVSINGPSSTILPAYILYTSGSTGVPKGVIQTQNNILKHINNYSMSLNITYKDGLVLFATYASDAAVMDIYSAILNAATLYVIDIRNKDPKSILSFLSLHNITILHLVPTLFRYLTEFIDKINYFKNLRYIVLGGEAVSKKDIEIFNQKFDKNTILVNGYGPTECTVAFQYFIKHGSIVNSRVPIGKPLKGINSFLHNIDKNKKIGEIVIESENVAYGYFNNPELTARFFKISHDKRINTFYTGDYGYIDENGNLIYVGRRDGQLKINGQKVYLSDIEFFLQNHNEITHSCVLQTIRNNNLLVVAFVVSSKHSSLTIQKIRKLLELNFPSYMQPSDVVMLSKLPLTLNGKVDRVALKKIYVPSLSNNEYIPGNLIEKKIIKIFQDILSNSKIITSRSIVQMGGDSISMLRIIMQLQNAFKISLSLNEFSPNFQIINIIKYIQKKISNNDSHINPKKESILIRTNFYNLSQAQLRYWYRIKNGLSNVALNLAYSIYIEGDMKIERLYSAVEQTLLRHQIFKVCFEENKGIPYQKIQNQIIFLPKLRNLQSLDFSQQSKELNASKIALLNYSFDFNKGNLFHIEFIKVSDKQYIMLYVIHHLIFDGWSNTLFLEEVWRNYNSVPTSKTKATLSHFNEYQDYVYQEQSKMWLSKSHKIKFWTNIINKTNLFHTNIYRDNFLSEDGAIHSFTIDTKFIKNIIDYTKANNITPFGIYLALFKFTIYALNREVNLLTTTDIAGRENYKFKNTIGLFTDILPIPITLMPDLSIQENIHNIYVTYEKCIRNKIPFAVLMRKFYPDTLKCYDKIFPNAFIFQNYHNINPTVSNLKITISELLNLKMSRELIFEVIQKDQLTINIYYKIDKYSSDNIKKMSEIYNSLIQLFCKTNSTKLCDALKFI